MPRDEKGTGKLSTALFYRGHIYENTTEVILVGSPTREVIYTPPQGPGAFGIRTDRGAVAGAVTILVDLTNEHERRTLVAKDTRRSDATRRGQEGLASSSSKDLPPGTTVTLASFYGTERANGTRLAGHRSAAAFTKDGTTGNASTRRSRNARAVGGSTPSRGAITKVLSKKHEQGVLARRCHDRIADAHRPDRRSGQLGADRRADRASVYPDQKEPGPVALQALLGTPDDVNLHIVFFGLTSESDLKAEKVGKTQFEILTGASTSSNRNAPPRSSGPGSDDAATLAEVCRNAMLPQFRYARGEQRPDQIEATIAGDSGMRVTPPLDPGVYNIRGLHKAQAVEIFPADRVLLEGRRRDGKFELFLPPYAHEVASRRDFPRHHSHGRDRRHPRRHPGVPASPTSATTPTCRWR